MYNIGMIHFRVGDIDGVSLEMDKWRIVLEDMGHEVIYIAGSLGQANGFEIREMRLDCPRCLMIKRNAFEELSDFNSEDDFKQVIQSQTKIIYDKLHNIIKEKKIEFIIPNNLFSLPMNIPASLALLEVIKKTNLRVLNHHHDFWWEREYYQPTVPLIQQYLDSVFPPSIHRMNHVVINNLAKQALEQRRRISSRVIPNVFDFTTPQWQKDAFNADFRKQIHVNPNDIIILQATRIVSRKGIELAIDLVKELSQPYQREKLLKKALYDGRHFESKSKVVLVLPNLIEDKEYYEKLKVKMKSEKIEFRFCNELVGHTRQSEPNKKYSLWDCYVHADLVTYPSLLEGWGNQFLEAVKAKIPVILYEYPVYQSDIKPAGFQCTSFGNSIDSKDSAGLVKIKNSVLTDATREVLRILTDAAYRTAIIETNYQIAKEKFSLQALSEYLKACIPLIQE